MPGRSRKVRDKEVVLDLFIGKERRSLLCGSEIHHMGMKTDMSRDNGSGATQKTVEGFGGKGGALIKRIKLLTQFVRSI